MVQPPWPEGQQELVSVGGLSPVCVGQEFCMLGALVCSEFTAVGCFCCGQSCRDMWLEKPVERIESVKLFSPAG